jgi:hypothetical protein
MSWADWLAHNAGEGLYQAARPFMYAADKDQEAAQIVLGAMLKQRMEQLQASGVPGSAEDQQIQQMGAQGAWQKATEGHPFLRFGLETAMSPSTLLSLGALGAPEVAGAKAIPMLRGAEAGPAIEPFLRGLTTLRGLPDTIKGASNVQRAALVARAADRAMGLPFDLALAPIRQARAGSLVRRVPALDKLFQLNHDAIAKIASRTIGDWLNQLDKAGLTLDDVLATQAQPQLPGYGGGPNPVHVAGGMPPGPTVPPTGLGQVPGNPTVRHAPAGTPGMMPLGTSTTRASAATLVPPLAPASGLPAAGPIAGAAGTLAPATAKQTALQQARAALDAGKVVLAPNPSGGMTRITKFNIAHMRSGDPAQWIVYDSERDFVTAIQRGSAVVDNPVQPALDLGTADEAKREALLEVLRTAQDEETHRKAYAELEALEGASSAAADTATSTAASEPTGQAGAFQPSPEPPATLAPTNGEPAPAAGQAPAAAADGLAGQTGAVDTQGAAEQARLEELLPASLDHPAAELNPPSEAPASMQARFGHRESIVNKAAEGDYSAIYRLADAAGVPRERLVHVIRDLFGGVEPGRYGLAGTYPGTIKQMVEGRVKDGQGGFLPAITHEAAVAKVEQGVELALGMQTGDRTRDLATFLQARAVDQHRAAGLPIPSGYEDMADHKAIRDAIRGGAANADPQGAILPQTMFHPIPGISPARHPDVMLNDEAVSGLRGYQQHLETARDQYRRDTQVFDDIVQRGLARNPRLAASPNGARATLVSLRGLIPQSEWERADRILTSWESLGIDIQHASEMQAVGSHTMVQAARDLAPKAFKSRSDVHTFLAQTLPQVWKEQALLTPRFIGGNATDIIGKSLLHGRNPFGGFKVTRAGTRIEGGVPDRIIAWADRIGQPIPARSPTATARGWSGRRRRSSAAAAMSRSFGASGSRTTRWPSCRNPTWRSTKPLSRRRVPASGSRRPATTCASTARRCWARCLVACRPRSRPLRTRSFSKPSRTAPMR